jgi:hypothetical protein
MRYTAFRTTESMLAQYTSSEQEKKVALRGDATLHHQPTAGDAVWLVHCAAFW